MSHFLSVGRGRALVLLLALSAALCVASPTGAQRGPRCDGERATIVGSRRGDTLRGTSGRDVIVGRGGNDIIRGLRGSDVICGGAGHDRLVGGPGRDRLHGLSGRDVVFGGDGSDRLFGYGAGSRPDRDQMDRLHGGAGDDRLDVDDQFFCCEEDRGPDRLRGGKGTDLLASSAGSNLLHGGTGHDRAFFSDETNANLATGFAEHQGGSAQLVDIENLTGSQGDDVLIGDDGPNHLFDGFESSGDDVLHGGGGDDRLESSLGDDEVHGGEGDDVFELYCCIDNYDGVDVYRGDAGADYISAGFGGTDTIDGGAGADSVSWWQAVDSVDADLQAGTATVGGEITTLIALEWMHGSSFDDRLLGDAGDNALTGERGDDLLDGREGNDHLHGGDGTDTCTNGETLEDCE